MSYRRAADTVENRPKVGRRSGRFGKRLNHLFERPNPAQTGSNQLKCLDPNVSTQNVSHQVSLIYKICSASAWREAERQGVYGGSSDDVRDGFIHFSSATQVRDTATRYFAGAEDLMLIAVDADALGDALKWEVSRGGDLFPHLYSDLPLAAVLWVRPLPLGIDQQHVFPEIMP